MATARSSCTRPTPRSSRSTPRPARSSGRSRTAIPARARPAPTRRWWSRTRSSSASRAASSACAAGSRPTTSRTASRSGAPIPTGPDDEMLIDPAEDHLARQAGRQGFQPQDLAGRPVEDRRRRRPGAGTSYDPQLNLIYYGSGNPSTWNPKQRPGDNKWSMTIFARDADTGMAKWVYQMTPHDEWDYDGVNEMILADQQIGGQDAQAAGAFRPQRLRLHARPRRPASCWSPRSTIRR